MTKDIHLHIIVDRKAAAAVLAGLVVVCFAYEAISETIAMTTYYPAPVGVYKKMTTTQQTVLGRDSGNVVLLGSANVGGMVGVGTTSPAAKLDVNGSGRFAQGAQLGNDAAACVTSKAGTMRWNGTAMQFCDGAGWKPFAAGVPSSSELCAEANGAWVSGPNVCYFSGSSCPSGWSPSASYTSTQGTTCGSASCNSCNRCGSTCSTGSHYRQNTSPESCTGQVLVWQPQPCSAYPTPSTCSAPVIEIGCSKNL